MNSLKNITEQYNTIQYVLVPETNSLLCDQNKSNKSLHASQNYWDSQLKQKIKTNQSTSQPAS